MLCVGQGAGKLFGRELQGDATLQAKGPLCRQLIAKRPREKERERVGGRGGKLNELSFHAHTLMHTPSCTHTHNASRLQ